MEFYFETVTGRDEWAEHLKLSRGYRYVSFPWQLKPMCFTTGWGERVMQFETVYEDTGEQVQPEIREIRPMVTWVQAEGEEDEDGACDEGEEVN